MSFKDIVLSIIYANCCLDLELNPFEGVVDILEKFTNDSEEMYKNMLEHIKEGSYLSIEYIHKLNEINNLKNMSHEDGFEYVKGLYRSMNGFVANEDEGDDITDMIITYIMYLTYSKGYPKITLEPFEVCHCTIYSSGDHIFDRDPFTRTMQTLFTIHALIYDKKDVNQWWNNLSTSCKNIFRRELQYILDNDLQYEYLPNTKYFDQFVAIYISL